MIHINLILDASNADKNNIMLCYTIKKFIESRSKTCYFNTTGAEVDVDCDFVFNIKYDTNQSLVIKTTRDAFNYVKNTLYPFFRNIVFVVGHDKIVDETFFSSFDGKVDITNVSTNEFNSTLSTDTLKDFAGDAVYFHELYQQRKDTSVNLASNKDTCVTVMPHNSMYTYRVVDINNDIQAATFLILVNNPRVFADVLKNSYSSNAKEMYGIDTMDGIGKYIGEYFKRQFDNAQIDNCIIIKNDKFYSNIDNLVANFLQLSQMLYCHVFPQGDISKISFNTSTSLSDEEKAVLVAAMTPYTQYIEFFGYTL